MPEPLKELFNPRVIAEIARIVHGAYPAFDAAAFTASATRGLAELELKARSQHIADALALYLPSNVPDALNIIIDSLPEPPTVEENHEITSFMYMPLTMFVAQHGLPHFELGMKANYELTKRFTSEFSIRPFILRYQEAALMLLHEWTSDENHHVRRLVSEGTRPRLPWASRLPPFQKNPKPVIALLEKLKDDSSLYVRRSVANNLNDIGKDNPEALFSVAKRWLKGASEDRAWVVQHALRSSVKRGEKGAFEVLGFDKPPTVDVTNVTFNPVSAKIGQSVRISFSVVNKSRSAQDLLIDLAVHFVKANGNTSPKVFKLTTTSLAPGESINLRKTISLKQHTTRTHFPGVHRVDVVVNGQHIGCGEFLLTLPGR